MIFMKCLLPYDFETGAHGDGAREAPLTPPLLPFKIDKHLRPRPAQHTRMMKAVKVSTCFVEISVASQQTQALSGQHDEADSGKSALDAF
jgi:hypothetical protein